jgi:CHAT domain-containing protein
MQSSLTIGSDETMTLAHIHLLDLPACRLVLLSACETGLTDPSFIPDEFVGLPSAFLAAGAATVISTLWRLNDESAPLLVNRFYRSHLLEGMSIPAALRAAQLWLRDATRETLLAELERLDGELPADHETARASITAMRARLYERCKPKERPYAGLRFWSAWQTQGI